MILIINVCKEKLHYYEFVKPIEDILKKNKIAFFTKHYTEIKESDLKKANKAIICGTSLKDFDYNKHLGKFSWIKNFNKPILGICAGMQLMQIADELDRQVKELDIKSDLNLIVKKKTEIGYYFENFKKEFLSLKGKHEVYHLHNNYIPTSKNFEQFNDGKIPQAIKHKTKPIYGVLFHPEVRNKKLIEEFCEVVKFYN